MMVILMKGSGMKPSGVKASTTIIAAKSARTTVLRWLGMRFSMTIPPAVAPAVCGMRRNIRESGQHVPSRAYYIGWRVKKQRNRKIFFETALRLIRRLVY